MRGFLYRIYVICILLLHQQQNVDAVALYFVKNVLTNYSSDKLQTKN